MNYDLRCEGFALDEELQERLLLQARSVVLNANSDQKVNITVRQIDGRVQGRIEVVLPGRKISSVVWRSNPVDAVAGAARAVTEAIDNMGRSTKLSNRITTKSEGAPSYF